MSRGEVDGPHAASEEPHSIEGIPTDEQLKAALATLPPLTRHSAYRGDKLSRLAPPSELIKRQSSCGIRGLAGGGNMAPSLQDD